MCCHFPFFIFSYTNQTIKKKKTSRLFFSLAFSLRVVVNQRYQKKHFGYSILILKAALDILSDYQCSDDYIYKIPPVLHYSQGYPEKCFLDFKMIAACQKIAPKWERETFFLVSMMKRRIKNLKHEEHALIKFIKWEQAHAN